MSKDSNLKAMSIIYVISSVVLFLFTAWNLAKTIMWLGIRFLNSDSFGLPLYIFLANTILCGLYLIAGIIGLNKMSSNSMMIKRKCISSCIMLLLILSILMNITINGIWLFFSLSTLLLTIWDIAMIVVSILYFKLSGNVTQNKLDDYPEQF